MYTFSNIDTKLEMLLNGEKIGMGATATIRDLYETGKISKEQQQLFLEMHFPNKNKIIEENQNNITEIDPRTGKQFTKKGLNSVKATRCQDCGDLLNGGTYGFIFRSIANPKKIIKGSSEGHSQAFSCPPDFEVEYAMYNKIADFFPANMEIISLVNVSKNWVENRRCYLEMDEILPVVLTKPQIKKALSVKDTLPDNKAYIIDKLLANKGLFMLLPGDKDPFRAEEGGGETSEWVEIGKKTIDVYFSVLGMDSEKYYKELNKLVDISIANDIKLNDVEFILGTIDGKTRVYMIDFDKVEKIPDSSRQNFLETKMMILNQPMFLLPGETKIILNTGTTTTKKKKRRKKKKKKGGCQSKRRKKVAG